MMSGAVALREHKKPEKTVNCEQVRPAALAQVMEKLPSLK
jgi:hypothetical protein